jgi:hypothetical protein
VAALLSPTDAVVAIAIGSAVAAAALRTWWRAGRARRWPRVDGIVEYHTVVEPDTDDLPHVRVSYVYVIDGRRYGGDRVRFDDGPHFTSVAAARAWAERKYPAGTAVQAYVDPADPRRAVLEVEKSVGTLLAAAAGLGIAAAGVGALLSAAAGR